MPQKTELALGTLEPDAWLPAVVGRNPRRSGLFLSRRYLAARNPRDALRSEPTRLMLLHAAMTFLPRGLGYGL